MVLCILLALSFFFETLKKLFRKSFVLAGIGLVAHRREVSLIHKAKAIERLCVRAIS